MVRSVRKLFRICEILLPLVVGILALDAIIMKLMGHYVGMSIWISVAMLILSILTVVRSLEICLAQVSALLLQEALNLRRCVLRTKLD